MLRLRLIFGTSLAALLVVLICADGYLSTCTAPAWRIAALHFDAGPWLYGGAITTGVVLLFAWAAARELVKFARARGLSPAPWLPEIGSAGLVLGPWMTAHAGTPTDADAWALLLIAAVLGLAFLYQAAAHRTENVLANVSVSMFIVIYTGGLAQFLCRVRLEAGGEPGAVGAALLLLGLIVVKMADTGAFFTGTLIGRHKMIPWVSPKKTWEGFVGGVVTATVCAVVGGHLLVRWNLLSVDWPPSSYYLALVAFGLIGAGLSVAGDLCASLLKRDAAMKDSGESLPGLGGVLDVLDSPLLAAPIVWLFWTRIVPILPTHAG